jgi:hypothetical protein
LYGAGILASVQYHRPLHHYLDPVGLSLDIPSDY